MDTVTVDVRLELYVDQEDIYGLASAQRAIDYVGCFVKHGLRLRHVPRIGEGFPIPGVNPERGVVVTSVEHYTTASWAGAADDRPHTVVAVRAARWDTYTTPLEANGWSWQAAETVAW